MSEFTKGKLESVGATKLWITGKVGGAVCVISDPYCPTSSCFREVKFGSKRWDEAMGNAERLMLAWNCHDELVEALRGIIAVADRKTDEFEKAHAAIAKATQSK
jgi:hypothetical protein